MVFQCQDNSVRDVPWLGEGFCGLINFQLDFGRLVGASGSFQVHLVDGLY